MTMQCLCTHVRVRFLLLSSFPAVPPRHESTDRYLDTNARTRSQRGGRRGGRRGGHFGINVAKYTILWSVSTYSTRLSTHQSTAMLSTWALYVKQLGDRILSTWPSGGPYVKQLREPYAKQLGGPYAKQLREPYAKQLREPYSKQLADRMLSSWGSVCQAAGGPHVKQLVDCMPSSWRTVCQAAGDRMSSSWRNICQAAGGPYVKQWVCCGYAPGSWGLVNTHFSSQNTHFLECHNSFLGRHLWLRRATKTTNAI